MENTPELLHVGETIITGDEVYVNTIMAAWKDYVNNHDDVKDLFTREYQGNTEVLHGYGMKFQEYAALIGSPNCHSFKVRYGYDANAASDSFKFKVIIFGVDNQGVRVSSFCIPGQVLTIKPPFPICNGPGSGLVAPQLANLWLDNWDKLETFESEIFKVAVFPDGGGDPYIDVLKGYNFSSDDFHQVIEVHSSAIESVYTFMVMHEILPADADEASLLFGNMIASTDNSHAVISNFYDLSSPCPKTC